MTARRKIGRPTAYRPEDHPRLARELTGKGKTLADVAKLFKVNRDTVVEWMKVHPEFSVAVQMGREDACDRVERALFERATGYSHPAVKIVTVSDGAGSGSHIERVPVTEHYPPDTAAARLYLMNVRPVAWRDRQEVQHSGAITLEQILAQSGKPATTEGA